jgi:hypothetical protein
MRSRLCADEGDKMSAPAVTAGARPFEVSDRVRLYVVALVIAVVAEFIGIRSFPLGPGTVLLLPMLWALVLGAALGCARTVLPAPLSLPLSTQWYSSAVVQPALLLLIAKLGLLVGASLPKVIASGWALIFQEFGHFFGTALFGLPIALLLGIKREAIGATFSVGREPSLAIIGEKYGMNSAEGRGVLAEYITGTIIGAVFIGLLAGFVASLNIFHPNALAMGAGVGSASMMTAASGAIAKMQTPEAAKEVLAFAAAANLLTSTVGTYFTLFISLPFTVWAYQALEPVLGRIGMRARVTADTSDADAPAVEAGGYADLSLTERIVTWVLSGILVLICSAIATKTNPLDAVPGMIIMIAVVGAGYWVYRLTNAVVPAVCWVSLIGMALTYPGMPGSAEVARLTGMVGFLPLTTPILTFAGLSIAKDVPVFRKLGWPIIVTSLMANAGTFLGATLIAQFFQH